MIIVTLLTRTGNPDGVFHYKSEVRARFMLNRWGFVELNPSLYRNPETLQIATVEVFYDNSNDNKGPERIAEDLHLRT